MKNHRTATRDGTLYGGPMTSRSTFLKLGLAAALAPFLGGCSPAPMPISRSATDPSSPSAPEGVSPMMAAPPPPAPPTKAAGGHEHHAGHGGHAGHADHAAATDAGVDGVVYVCPMHPEVTSISPGSLCPKCNMKLVPKK